MIAFKRQDGALIEAPKDFDVIASTPDNAVVLSQLRSPSPNGKYRIRHRLNVVSTKGLAQALALFTDSVLREAQNKL